MMSNIRKELLDNMSMQSKGHNIVIFKSCINLVAQKLELELTIDITKSIDIKSVLDEMVEEVIANQMTNYL